MIKLIEDIVVNKYSNELIQSGVVLDIVKFKIEVQSSSIDKFLLHQKAAVEFMKEQQCKAINWAKQHTTIHQPLEKFWRVEIYSENQQKSLGKNLLEKKSLIDLQMVFIRHLWTLLMGYELKTIRLKINSVNLYKCFYLLHLIQLRFIRGKLIGQIILMPGKNGGVHTYGRYSQNTVNR